MILNQLIEALDNAKGYIQDYVKDEHTGQVVPNVNKVASVRDLRL